MTNDDRRSTPRYAPAQDQARLGWWDGGRFVSAEARLRDISSGGAALRVDHDSPPPPGSVWVCLAGAGEWVATDLAGSSTSDNGACAVRLEFASVCPYEVFKAAVWGGTASPFPSPAPAVTSGPSPEAAAPGSTPSAWAQGAGPADGGFCSVALAAADLAPDPSPWKVERARYVARRRSRALPWVAKLALGLCAAALLGAALASRVDAVRALGATLSAGLGR